MPEKLTADLVKKVKAPSVGSLTIWDDGVTGFGVRVYAPTRRRPHGDRSFFVNYRVDGREKRLTIGSFPEWTV